MPDDKCYNCVHWDQTSECEDYGAQIFNYGECDIDKQTYRDDHVCDSFIKYSGGLRYPRYMRENLAALHKRCAEQAYKPSPEVLKTLAGLDKTLRRKE